MRKETVGSASASLVLGILGMFLFIPAIPAIICGHVARSRIKRHPHIYAGNGMALAGLILGYVVIIVTIVGFVLFDMYGDTLKKKMSGAVMSLDDDSGSPAQQALEAPSFEKLRRMD